MQGPVPTADMGANFGQSTTSELNSSATQTRSTNYSIDASTSSTVSIKDWGSYGKVNETKQAVTWSWVQEYPWSFLRYRLFLTKDEVALDMQPSDKMALYDGNIVTPPSELSTFGPDFTSKVQWMIRSKEKKEVFDSTITVTCEGDVYRATHGVSNKKLLGKMYSMTLPVFKLPIVSLAKLALETYTLI